MNSRETRSVSSPGPPRHLDATRRPRGAHDSDAFADTTPADTTPTDTNGFPTYLMARPADSRFDSPPHLDAAAHGQDAIRAGSSSFASAARLFDEHTRQSTVMLYAWCRHCDDVIDGQVLGHGQQQGDRGDEAEGNARIASLEADTRRACAGEHLGHPVFDGFAEVMRRHEVPLELPLEHLRGFAMDVDGVRYRSLSDLLLYCYRVAGVVGLMMARVMGTRDARTLDRACDLGIAFQLTNIARDIVEDAQIGRVYVPLDWLDAAGVPHDEVADPRHREVLAMLATRLVDAAEPYYASAREGIAHLPLRSAWSVATARDVYRAIGHEVKRRGSHAWDARVSTTTLDKLWFVARGAAVALAARTLPEGSRDERLWQRPHDGTH